MSHIANHTFIDGDEHLKPCYLSKYGVAQRISVVLLTGPVEKARCNTFIDNKTLGKAQGYVILRHAFEGQVTHMKYNVPSRRSRPENVV